MDLSQPLCVEGTPVANHIQAPQTGAVFLLAIQVRRRIIYSEPICRGVGRDKALACKTEAPDTDTLTSECLS